MRHAATPPDGPAESPATFRLVWCGVAAGLIALVWMVQIRITAGDGIMLRHRMTAPETRPSGGRLLKAQVLTSARIPMSGVRVVAVRGFGASGIEVAETRSDEKGWYAIEVPPDATRLVARIGERRAEVWLKPDGASPDLILR